MIDNIAIAYRKANLGIISAMAGDTKDILYEAGFLNKGFLYSQVERIQQELSIVSEEIKIIIESNDNTQSGINRKNTLLEKREMLLYQLVFTASNDFSNLDKCISLLEGHSIPFGKCIEGMKAFAEGKEKEAFSILDSYYRNYQSVENHFLCNKTFGILLKNRAEYRQAIKFLTYALQQQSTDVECLDALEECYKSIGKMNEKQSVNKIRRLLAK